MIFFSFVWYEAYPMTPTGQGSTKPYKSMHCVHIGCDIFRQNPPYRFITIPYGL